MTAERMPRCPVVAAWMLATAAITGCAGPEPPSEHFYRLRLVDAPSPAQTVSLLGGIEVERPVADGEIGNRAIVYVSADADSELHTFSYHFWAAPPANMLQNLLVRCLEDGRVADRVLKPEQRIEARYTLFSQVQHLELQTSSPRRVLLALDVALRDDPHRQLLLSRSFRAEAAPADHTVGAAVDALNQALATVCRDLVADLARR